MAIKHAILTLLGLLIISAANAQQTPDAFMFSSDAQPVPIIPQSPEAGSLGRYGTIPMTKATGQMGYSVPIYTIEVDGHSWPISLNYNYGGLILEGKPSLTGLGWSLQAEAAVTREVRGLPDESRYGYYGNESLISGIRVKDFIDDYIFLEFDEDINTSGMDAWNLNTLRNFRDGVYDAEVDKFTVNVGNLNFSFKLTNYVYDSNGNVISADAYFLSRHANKVDVEWSDRDAVDSRYNSFVSAFTVTDTDGVKYRFDVLEKVVPQGIDEEFQSRPITTWKLSRITYLNNQTIDFWYSNAENYDDYNYRASGSTLITNLAGQSENPNGFAIGPYNPNETVELTQGYGEDITKGQIERKVLESIVFPKGSMEFSRYTNPDGRQLYHKIELFNDFDTSPVKTFDLSYSGNRDFLDSIQYNGSPYYEFEYHDEIPIPPFINSITDLPLARQQDSWKFYNGAGNPYAFNMPNSPIGGVNKSPSLLHTRLGALKRIIYPTKGSTYIYYQQNQIKTELLLDSGYYQSLPPGQLFQLELDAQIDQESTKNMTIEVLYPTVAYINHTISGDRGSGGITLSLNRLGGPTNYTVSHEGETIPPYAGANDFYYDVAPYLRQEIIQRNFPFSYPPMYPNFIEEFGYADTDNGGNGTYDTVTRSTGPNNEKILIMPGTYKLEISTITLGADVRGSINIQTFGAFNVPPPETVNKDVGGLRVDYMKDCPDGTGENCFITNYHYNDSEGLSYGTEYTVPLLETGYVLEYIPEGQTYTARNEYRTYVLNQFTVSNPAIGTPVFYSKIKTVKRRNGSVTDPVLKSNGSVVSSLMTEIGHTETTYSLPFENTLNLYPQRPTGVDLDKSLPLESRQFEQDSTTYISRSETIFTPIRKPLDYSTLQDEDNNHPWSLKVFLNQYRLVDLNDSDYKIYSPLPGSEAERKLKELHGVLPYRELDVWDRVNKTINEIDGVSTSISYSYNSNHKVIEEKSTDSRGVEMSKSYKYANDFPELSDMVAKNQLSVPVETLVKYGEESITRSKSSFILNANGYKPYKSYVAKGDGPLEAKMKYNYDNAGRIIQIDQLLDSPNRYSQGEEKILKSTSYVWGYNNEYPVVKAENATISQLNSAGADLILLRSATGSLEQKRTELNSLRNALPSAFIDGYTYQSLIGIKNNIDSRGYTTFYAYDDLNRLLRVKDDNEKILKEYEYKFRSGNYSNPDDVLQYPALGGTINGDATVSYGTTVTYSIIPEGGSGDFSFDWYQDGGFLASNMEELDVVFNVGPSSLLSVTITDNITGATLDLTRTVDITSDLGTVNLEATPAFGYVGDVFTLTSSGINEGSGSLSYEWSINGGSPEVYSEASNFTTTLGTVGQQEVRLTVTDDITGSSITGTETISILDPLPALTLTASDTFILAGEQVTLTPTSLDGGFYGFTDVDWSIVSDQGTVVLTNKFDDPFNYTFSNVGLYQVVYKVTALVTGEVKQATVDVNVSGGLSVGNSTPSTEHILVNSPITFSMPVISGSGNYDFEWLVQNTVQSTTGSDFTFSGFPNQDNYFIKLRVTDLELNQIRESQNVEIHAWNELFNPVITKSANPVYTNESVNFNTIIGGGSGDRSLSWYRKYENNAETFSGSANSLSTSFSIPGTYTVRVVVSDDNIDNHEKEDDITFEVYNRLNVGNVSANLQNILVGTAVSFTAPTVSGGSDNKQYQWLVNGVVRSTSSGNFTYNQFNSAGSYNVKYRVIDNDLNVTTDSQVVSINAYNPLSQPSFTQTVNHISVNDQLWMNTSNLGGGSGSYIYAWYVKLNSGNYVQVSGANGTSLTYNSFSSAGTYTIKFRITDSNIPSHFKETTRTVNVYNPVQISNSDISTPSPVQVETNTYFHINPATGGSGDFTYYWSYKNWSATPTNQGSLGSSTTGNLDNFYLGSYAYVGTSIEIKCRVHDNLTNKDVTVSKYITVEGDPLSIPRVFAFDTDADPETASMRLSTSVSGGSGSYTFRFVVNGVVVQESSSNVYNSVYLNCSNPTAAVSCVVIDAVSGQVTSTNLQLNPSLNCGSQN